MPDKSASKLRLRQTVVASLVLGFAATAAQADGGRAGRLFDRLDGDGDGRLTQQEVHAKQRERSARLDGNGDGVLTRDEFVAGVSRSMAERVDRLEDSDHPRARRWLSRLDRNGDGKLSEEERTAFAGRLFERLDGDGDQRLTEADSQARLERLFARADLNADGVIDRDEAARLSRRGKNGARD